MAVADLALISNPGSASRKYALFTGKTCRAQLHFEHVRGRVMCTLRRDEQRTDVPVEIDDIMQAAEQVLPIFVRYGVVQDGETIAKIALRIVAPGSFFLQDHIITETVVARLREIEQKAPLHIRASLAELAVLRRHFAHTPIIGVSDSAFHHTKPSVALHYGIPFADAEKLDIKRFGYHGLSAAAVVRILHARHQLPAKLIVCHLGSGASVMAIHNGRSVDTSMGYSPLEGLLMATRSGSLDLVAAHVLKQAHHMDDAALETYLNAKSGLLGLSGVTSDIRELLLHEATNGRARLALNTYAFMVQKAVGSMASVLNGADMLVFTGAVGERSAPMRQRIIHSLRYLDFTLDHHVNDRTLNPVAPTMISLIAHSKPVWIIPADEATQMAHQAAAF